MKHIILFFFLAASPCVAANKNIGVKKNAEGNPISFTENKGQVCDQNYLPRPDVLFSGSDGKLVYHIKSNGISYQLSKIDSQADNDEIRNLSGMVSKSLKTPDKVSVYRIDVSWLNANSHPGTIKEELLPGYNNYYLQHCPDGVLNVESFKRIILSNLYNGINLHYYEKEGCLKYDFVVSAHTDYKKIKLKVEGAEMSLQKDGSLLLQTPLGTICEGKPVAYQNGKELHARWKIESNVLNFEVDGVDPNAELIIDPPTRIWGTYYGGSGSDQAFSTATDNLGNVYIAGVTASNGGTTIATSGAYQTTYGLAYDGFVAKFNSSGVRLWGTYYGGNFAEYIKSVDTDNSGNVYAVGYTGSGSSIATAGSQQSTYGGGTYDGFLVKFNSAGVRQWSTYYGSTGDDYIWSCDVESSGNIYISGFTSSSGNYFATASAFQAANAGGPYDAFLAKFNSSGARIWSTYYGGNGNDQSYSCSSDNKGSVYLSGFTDSATVALTTPGAHQATFGGIEDAFLVRFDSSGTRLWGTFYGGAGIDWGSGCTTDTTGNVYLIGYSSGATSTAIATPGTHQSIYGGGAYDAFCAKFNSSGARQWGTFYGGSGIDYVFGCATDITGNIYISGQTTSPSSTIMVSSGAYQSAYGGGTYDAFFAKLDPSGIRQWGSFYGGTSVDISYDCTVDYQNNLFVTGYSTSTNTISISTPGTHQTINGGNNDAFLVKFDGCGVLPPPGSIIGITSFCGSAGSPQTYSVAPVSGALSYNWSFSSGWSGSSTTNSITISNITSSGYLAVSVTNSCGAGPVSAINVTVFPNPVISVSGGTICSGNNFTLTPTGASTYTFSSGNAIVSPTTNTTYSVIGTSTAGCVSSNTAVATIAVVNTPTLTIVSSSSVICSGNSVVISASGATSYTFNPGGTGPTHTFTPLSNTIYTITGSNGSTCSKDTKTISVTVNTTPTIVASASSPTICTGQTATITTSGASGYTLYPGVTTGATQTVSPMSTTVYSITGTNSVNCSNTVTLNIIVYPNPTVSVVSSNSILCVGQTATLTASGASTYTWNTASTSTSVIVTPSVTSTFSVTGTSSGCSYLCAYTQSVSSCLGLEYLSQVETEISIFPNPNNGEFIIVVDKIIEGMSAEIVNSLGQLVRKELLLNLKTKINLQAQAEGIYFIRIIVWNKPIIIKKIIKT